MKELKKCNLCKSTKLKFLYDAQDRAYAIKDRYSLFRCRSCGLIFLNPQPSSKELSKHYPKNNYYSIKQIEESKIITLLYDTYLLNKKNMLYKIILLPFRQLIRTSKIVPRGKCLDVGCGNGDFLLKMKKAGMDCYGVEPGEFDKTFVKKNKLNIKSGTLEDAKFPSNYFDVITLNHVFEHVNNPSDVLNELHRILKPNGTLIIGIPQTSSLAYRLFGKYWAAIEAPRHLFLYSRSNIKRYAKESAFKINKIRYYSTPQRQFIESLFYLFIRSRKKHIRSFKEKLTNNKFLFFLFFPISTACNLLKIGDAMEIIMTKSSKFDKN